MCTYCLPGIELGPRVAAVNKTDAVLLSWSRQSSGGDRCKHKPIQTHDHMRVRAHTGGLSGQNRDCFIWGLGEDSRGWDIPGES